MRNNKKKDIDGDLDSSERRKKQKSAKSGESASNNNPSTVYQFILNDDNTYCTVKDSYDKNAKVLFDADINDDSITYYSNGEEGAKVVPDSIITSGNKTVSITGGTDRQCWDILLMPKNHPEFRGKLTLDPVCFENFSSKEFQSKANALKQGIVISDDINKYKNNDAASRVAPSPS